MICPVCLYKDLPYAPNNYNICPCCGTEFGNDDAFATHADLQRAWVEAGMPWFFGNPPANWNGLLQLIEGGRIENVPLYSIQTSMDAAATITLPSSDVVYA
jgi:hypothetical protein